MFLGKTSLYGGIKWHSILHFCYFMKLYGVTPNFDMVVHEHSHVGLKSMYRRTARNRNGNYEDLLKRMLSSDLCRVLREAFMESHPVIFNKLFYSKRVVDRAKVYSTMTTDDSVEFFCNKQANAVELLYDKDYGFIGFAENDWHIAVKFLNPLMAEGVFSNVILQYFPPDYEVDFNRWKVGNEGMKNNTNFLFIKTLL